MRRGYLTKQVGLFISCGLALSIFVISCADNAKDNKRPSDHDLAGQWADMALYITKHTPANSPTYASRCFGYIGLTMYECVVSGYASHQSMRGQLNGLDSLPDIDAPQSIDWAIALNAGQSRIISLIYNQTSDSNKVKIELLEESLLSQLSKTRVPNSQLERSVYYGRSVADAIFKWSLTDGGHRAYLRNFDKKWEHPSFEGSWKPPLFAQSFSHHPLHPYWGDNRTFAKANEHLELPEMIQHDTMIGSDYHNQFLAVYNQDQELTQEQKEAALWWGDDPDDTFTPPGHSYYIASIATRSREVDLITAAETYARVGLSVADAFINCWQWKYHFFTERPNTFIPNYIEPYWESFWPDPPFPSFPSGHAIQAAAAATALIDIYGDSFAFIDSSHVGRERDEVREVDFKPRSFESFWEVAEETADSRFYGGIHIPIDNEVGLAQGKIIARHVNELKWRTDK